MKKLIALISSVAIALSFSTFVFAADPIVIESAGDVTTTYDNATGEFSAKVPGLVLGSQGTILVHKGAQLKLTADATTYPDGTNIESINQQDGATETVFTFKLRGTIDPAEVYTVKIGGSDLLAAKVGTFKVKQAVPTNYTIKGKVNNVAEAPDYDNVFFEVDSADWGKFSSDLTTTWKTRIDFVPFSELQNYVVPFVDGGAEYEFVNPITTYAAVVSDNTVTPAISPGDFTLTIPATVESGTYALVVRRNGYLTFFKKINYQKQSINLTSSPINLIGGDVDGAVNLAVDPSDLLPVINGQSYYMDGNYNSKLDMNATGYIDPDDLLIIINNNVYGSDYPEYSNADQNFTVMDLYFG